jgi:predicted DCC family thiol-disulfide oxidoreductase YuxK
MARGQLDSFSTYSYRDDPSVPDFPDETPLIVFDGVCVLCNGFARFVAKRDVAKRFRFAEAQSPLGGALYRHYGLDDVDYETNLLIQDGRAYGRMEAFVHIVSQLGGAWPTVRLILGLPRPCAIGSMTVSPRIGIACSAAMMHVRPIGLMPLAKD